MTVAPGADSGNLRAGDTYLTNGACTGSDIIGTRCTAVRFVDTLHLFFKERRREVRL
jgi:fructose-1,6-bisphosphatase/sedoheptulose 1,7-bisphosphatase-like protein